VVGARVISYEVNIASCKNCWEYQPFDEYADGLRQAGFETGTIVVKNMYVGGNLRPFFPDARIVMEGYPLSIFPAAPPTGGCVLAWLGDKRETPDKFDRLREEFGLQTLPDTHQRGRIRRTIGAAKPSGDKAQDNRWFSMQYILVPGNGEACR